MASCVVWELEPGCCTDWDTYDSALQERATDLAWATLRVLTGGMVGYCPTVLRPCAPEPCGACWEWIRSPLAPYSPSRSCGGDQCSCVALSEVTLPGRVAVVEKVMLDGARLSITAYRLDGNKLLRTDDGVWPSCQDMRLGDDKPGTFAVYYVPGVVPGTSGQWAAGVLACEFAKACSGGKCRLPSAVTSISRQGVSMDINSGMFANGLTGIREVDAFILSVNPNTMSTPPQVWSPDKNSGRMIETF